MKFKQARSRATVIALFLLTQLLQPFTSRAQVHPSVIQGIVHGDNNQAVMGASVVIRNSKTNFTSGTKTDTSGMFTARVPAGGPYSFSITSVGYEPQTLSGYSLKQGATVSVDVTMKATAAALEQVVVVGYGTQRKKDVTGAVVSVSGANIKAVPVPAISNTLAGRLTGVIASNSTGEPGYDDASILIRGISTLNGGSAPLVVIDGVPDRAGGFSRLDANDVESVTVLKDASAAIYGARSANGVILVTTKRGKAGKPSINYTLNYGLRQPTRLPDMLDAATYALAINELNDAAGQSHTYSEEDIQKFRDGSDPLGHPNTNWLKETLKPVSGQYQHSLSVSGGSDKVKYYFSLGNQYQDGYYRKGATNYKQYNVRSNIDVQVTNNLKMALNLAGRQEVRNYPHHGSETIFRFITAAKPMALAYIPGTDLPALALGDDVNPVAAATDRAGYQKNLSMILNGDLGATLDLPWITKGLSLIGGVYMDYTGGFYKNFYKGFDLYKIQNNDTVPQHYGLATGDLSENMSRYMMLTSNIRLNYQRKFGNRHDWSGFVAYEQATSDYDYLSGYRSNLLSTQIDQLFAGEVNSQLTNNGTASKTARQNYFGRFGYSYDDRYLLQFNWRVDGSQNFPADKRFGFFPGVSGGWRISRENFMNAVNFIDDLKLRGSWGLLGNDNIAAFQYITRYVLANGGVFGGESPVLTQGLYIPVSANPNVTWETAQSSNIGFDLAVLKSKLTLGVDLYKTVRNDILIPRTAAVPGYLGLSLPNENQGKVESKGYEIAAHYRDNIKKFKYSVGLNFSYNTNKILNIAEPASVYPWQMQTGKPIGAPLYWEATGIYRSQEEIDKTPHPDGTKPGDLVFRDVDGDGKINGNDRVRQDITSVPRITYGIPANLSYKGWTMDLLLQGQAKSAQYVYFQSGTIGNFTQEYWDNHWTAANGDASGPRLYDRETIPTTSYTNTFFYRNSAFVRLKSLQLAYSFPSTLLNKLPFAHLQLYVSGFNLVTIDKLKYLDPEAKPNNQNYAGWYTPQTRVFNAGINVSFK
ncbi:TonB-dependent receptor [Paraflavisolibacter sp. H34]|uniref:SusC/RagA family TonB-linked outer membrane protein n=1 Tax=Huijunlia imazamoxiresistens TaxID=3127457 RepID=UPI003016BE78